MLQPTDRPSDDDVVREDAVPDPAMAEAVGNLRALILAGERYRAVAAGSVGLGTTESQAVSYLALHGARGQSELARDLRLTSSAATALVDRLEAHGVAARVRHPHDRRKLLVQLTSRGEHVVLEGQKPLLDTLSRVGRDELLLVSGWLGALAHELTARTA